MSESAEVDALASILMAADARWCAETGDERCGAEFHRFLALECAEVVRAITAKINEKDDARFLRECRHAVFSLARAYKEKTGRFMFEDEGNE